jgi:multisubunit Na+/H+ antiporter MnhF subunit
VGMTETGGRHFEGPGGTPGGVGEFLIGLVLFGIGIYLLFDRVTVHTSFWQMGGRSAFGISLIPVVIGIAMLFFKGTSILGWVLTLGGLLFILVGIITRMDIYFERTSLWNTLIMLALLGAGMGLVAKSLRPHRAGRDAS